jgi:hypothetical protein
VSGHLPDQGTSSDTWLRLKDEDFVPNLVSRQPFGRPYLDVPIGEIEGRPVEIDDGEIRAWPAVAFG